MLFEILLDHIHIDYRIFPERDICSCFLSQSDKLVIGNPVHIGALRIRYEFPLSSFQKSVEIRKPVIDAFSCHRISSLDFHRLSVTKHRFGLVGMCKKKKAPRIWYFYQITKCLYRTFLRLLLRSYLFFFTFSNPYLSIKSFWIRT